MADNKAIKFPEKHYVGFQVRKDHVHLGFMTPYGTDSAAKKRMGTVDNWTKSSRQTYDYVTEEYIESEEIPAVIYDNAPLTGFLFSNPVNHSSSWNSCRDKWRVEDPRGFELEVTSGNLEKIMNICTIVNGLVQEPCIWARLGAENVLVPVHSEEYQQAKDNTARMSVKVSMRDVPIGSLIELHDGTSHYYLGQFFVIKHDRYSAQQLDNVTVSTKKTYVFEDPKRRGHYRAVATPKVSSFKENGLRDFLYKDGMEKYINSKFEHMHHHTMYGIVGVSENTQHLVTNEVVENMNREDAKSLGYQSAFIDGEDGLRKFSASAEHYYHGDNRVTYDLVKSYEDLYVTSKFDQSWTWTRYVNRENTRQTMPRPERFNCVRVVVNTGKSKVFIKI